ncbi:hypothetical protein [Herbaspirillum hiltneri]|uniref:hypothetical protein n=1 Tax=Herbaspirillum hiltneri TaxID=341045 RepID=UPI0011875A51|nr:hypothetical protein [Herbaspirillum hiltneri]
MRLRLMAGLSAVFLLLLMAFATHYKVRLEMMEPRAGILEMLAAAIPLLSLVVASLFANPASRRRPGSSARR